jgi:hypothetical protein
MIVPSLPYSPYTIDHEVPDKPKLSIQVLRPRFEENVNGLYEA